MRFFFPVGSNDEIEISLVPRPWIVGEDGTNLEEPFFMPGVAKVMTAAFLRNLFLFWNGRQEGGENLQEHDQILGEVVACDLRHEDRRLLYRCQSLTCVS